MQLDDILQRLSTVSDKDKAALVGEAYQATKGMMWLPNPGPQTDAYLSEADEVFYGGQAGGGKTDLEIGLALTAHTRSLLLRRTNKEASGLVERMAEIVGSRDGWSSQANTWRFPERLVDIGGVQLEEDKQKYKGTPHDLICFDEISDFTESQYTFIIGWNRAANPLQRCRIVGAGNPPTRPEGLWVIKRWAAWLDPQHPHPAQPGELRWYTTINGKDTEVDGPGPHTIEGEPTPITARSRTFIPAKLSDNPDLSATNYASVLAALPEELRLAYRDGRFDTSLRDDAFQTIPTAWIRAAQERWKPTPPVGVPMCAIGADVAQGGADRSVLAPRHDGWYAPLLVKDGVETPDGKTYAGFVIANRRNNARVIIDIGGGWGGDAFAHLRENQIDAVGYMGVKASLRRTVDNTLKFTNVRTETYWRFREALDPSQEGGSPIALPPDAELVSDLCAPTYEVTPNGIKVEPKEKVCDRLGRSTDKGDAVVMAWSDGIKGKNIEGGWARRNQAPKVVMRKK